MNKRNYIQTINNSTTRKICGRCVMPESKPDIYLNEEGICNICLAHDAKDEEEPKKPLESDFLKILSANKTKGKYDCMVMCSGGKDSISALYYMKERYKLNPLAFTFDHGFETRDALENVYRAVEKLDVDLLFYKSNYMKDMFARIVRSSPETILCHPCSIWYMDTAFDFAEKYHIPIIVAGWTKGQSKNEKHGSKNGFDSQNPEFKAMTNATRHFLCHKLADMPKYEKLPRSMEGVIKKRKPKKEPW